jgi:hypothetical protein
MEEQEEYKINLYNRLIDISKEMDEVYKYHPNNPNRIDVISNYEELQREKRELEHLLDALI